MPWSCISWVTVDRYQRQFDADVPIGTPRSQVEDYLRREGVPFVESAATSRPGPSRLEVHKSFPALFDSMLEITIAFDANDGVSDIRFWKRTNAP